MCKKHLNIGILNRIVILYTYNIQFITVWRNLVIHKKWNWLNAIYTSILYNYGFT